MLYILMINYDPSIPFEGPLLQPEHTKLEAELRQRSGFVSGAGLMSVEAGGWVRVRGDKTLKTDGPFAETKKVLGGYYIVDCTKGKAMEIASRIPVESRSWVDVRRISLFHPNLEKIAAIGPPV
ncbi:MAG TPA: YciI family protein [Dehalococcoidia bacterium]|nr:YciI family protein [Dehalococcoidia bacterium]